MGNACDIVSALIASISHSFTTRVKHYSSATIWHMQEVAHSRWCLDTHRDSCELSPVPFQDALARLVHVKLIRSHILYICLR